MLVTVFQLRFGRWLPIREYYWFPRQESYVSETETTPTGKPKVVVDPCPGCGKIVKSNIDTAHHCVGGVSVPLIDEDKYRKNRRWRPELDIQPDEPHDNRDPDERLYDYINSSTAQIAIVAE